MAGSIFLQPTHLNPHIRHGQHRRQSGLKSQISTISKPKDTQTMGTNSQLILTGLDSTHWYHGMALVVVADNDLRRGVTSLFHDHKTAGHARISKTLQLIAPYYWWPGMKIFVTEYIKGCATCQMTKVNTHPAHPPMFPITPAENA